MQALLLVDHVTALKIYDIHLLRHNYFRGLQNTLVGATTATVPWKRDDVRAMAEDEEVSFLMGPSKLCIDLKNGVNTPLGPIL